jgi:hypothetical protein
MKCGISSGAGRNGYLVADPTHLETYADGVNYIGLFRVKN